MGSDAKNAAARRAARANWRINVHPLRDDVTDDLSEVTTASERLAMMRELAESAWRLAGRPLPSYPRHQMPGRMFRRGEARPDDDEN